MRVALLGVFFALVVAGQEPGSPGLLSAELLELEGTSSSGTLVVRDAQSRVTRCGYDSKTYIEMRKERVPANALRQGDRLELLLDREAGSAACYVRSAHLLLQTPPRSAPRPTSSSLYVIDSIYPRGNLTFAGVVVKLSPERLVLHTRNAEERILLRPDTRYLDSGVAVEASGLGLNRRVFVRCGRNLDNELEAFQVVWGEILQPK